MILTLAGLPWETTSPSHYRLVLPDDKQDVLDISFLGVDLSAEASRVGGWCLFLERHGDVSTRMFDKRDDAIGLVAEAFSRPLDNSL